METTQVDLKLSISFFPAKKMSTRLCNLLTAVRNGAQNKFAISLLPLISLNG